jgi:hypothetical protein
MSKTNGLMDHTIQVGQCFELLPCELGAVAESRFVELLAESGKD